MWRTFDPGTDWLARPSDETDFREAAVETDAVVQLLVHEAQLRRSNSPSRPPSDGISSITPR